MQSSKDILKAIESLKEERQELINNCEAEKVNRDPKTPLSFRKSFDLVKAIDNIDNKIKRLKWVIDEV